MASTPSKEIQHGRLVFRNGRWVEAHPEPEPTIRQPTMTYDAAMKLSAAGQLKGSVLTERGWVTAGR